MVIDPAVLLEEIEGLRLRADFAELAVLMRRHAALHEGAQFRSPISVADVLASRPIVAATLRDSLVSTKVDALLTDARDQRAAIIGNTVALIGLDKNVDELRREVIANRSVAKHAADHSLAALQAATEAAAQQDVMLAIVRGIDARLNRRVSETNEAVEAVVQEHHGLRAALAKVPPRVQGGAFVVAFTALAGAMKFCIDLYLTTKGLK